MQEIEQRDVDMKRIAEIKAWTEARRDLFFRRGSGCLVVSKRVAEDLGYAKFDEGLFADLIS